MADGTPDPEAKAALKAAQKQVNSAGKALRRAERQHSGKLSGAERELKRALTPKKLQSLYLGRAALYEDRVEAGGTRIPLVAGEMSVETALHGKELSVTIAGPGGHRTIKVPVSQAGKVNDFAAAVRIAAASSEAVGRQRQETAARLEAELGSARSDTAAVDEARAFLRHEEARTGLTYSAGHRTRNVILSAAAVFLLLGVIGAITGNDDRASSVASQPSSGPSVSQTVTRTETPVPAATATQPPKPAPATPTSAPKPKPTPKPKPKPAKPKPIHYQKLTKRQWGYVVRDPASHAGEHIVLYGIVTQADSGTGTESVRADVDAVRHPADFIGERYYPTNTLMDSGGSSVSRLLEDDEFRAEVTILGETEYETTLGGYLTVPEVRVEHITRF